MFKRWLALGALVGVGYAHAFVPQTGTWLVSSEANGKPGRGLAIDVQGQTLAMQMFAYESNGSATFYVTAGTLQDNQFQGTLTKYRGGRYFGSGDLVGQDAGSPGQVKMRFESGSKGYVTFPGEPEKEITRYSFAYGPNAQSLIGYWLLTPLNASSPTSDFVALTNQTGPTENGSGMVLSADGRFACDHMVRGEEAGWVKCVKINSSNQLQRIYYFQYLVNDGEGFTGLPSSNESTPLVVRRLTSDNGTGQGIWLKDGQAQEPADPSVARALLEQATPSSIAP